jgi:hypothetical protein
MTTTVRLNRLSSIGLGLSAAILIGAPLALGQTSATTMFEKHKLLGTFAWDCSKPASDNNMYYVLRAADGGGVQYDQMNGPTSRQVMIFFDQVLAPKPDEIAITGRMSGGKPATMLWRIDQARVLRLEMSVADEKWIADGRYVNNGNQVPALNKCGG